MSLITVDDYPAIRAAMDLSIDSAIVPDSTIGHEAFLGEAEREVLNIDPLAASRIDDEGSRIRTAVIYLTAARLLPSLPALTSEKMGNVGYSRQADDISGHVSRLRSWAMQSLNAVVDVSGVAPRTGLMFTVAKGRRGL